MRECVACASERENGGYARCNVIRHLFFFVFFFVFSCVRHTDKRSFPSSIFLQPRNQKRFLSFVGHSSSSTGIIARFKSRGRSLKIGLKNLFFFLLVLFIFSVIDLSIYSIFNHFYFSFYYGRDWTFGVVWKSFTVKIAKWKSLRWPCLPFALRLDLRVYWNYLTRRACSRVNIDLTSPSSLWIKGISHPQDRLTFSVVVCMAFHIDVKISPNQTVHSHILCVLEGEETDILMGQVSKKNKNKNKKTIWTMS